jgi:hypothetical protein
MTTGVEGPSNATTSQPSEPYRVRAFAVFFKRYMSISSIVLAALPLPITFYKVIPVFEGLRPLLCVCTPFLCFLTLGYIFYSRHLLGRIMFKRDWHFINWLPPILIVCMIFFFGFYISLFDTSLNLALKRAPNGITSSELVKTLPMYGIDYADGQVALYLAIFVCAEAAFILMAIKEYLQDLMGLTDEELIKGSYQRPSSSKRW